MRGCHKQYVMGRDCTEPIIEPIMAGRTNRFLLQRHCPWDGLCETSGVECLGIQLVIRGTACPWNPQFYHEQYEPFRGWRVQDIERASLYPAISSYCTICFNIFQHISSQLESQRSHTDPSLPSGSATRLKTHSALRSTPRARHAGDQHLGEMPKCHASECRYVRYV